MLTLLLTALDQTIVRTAMPRIIASTIAVPILAKLSDICGRKWFFLAGALLFVMASAWCCGAGLFAWMPGDGMTQLILFRGVQGLFAAVWGLASIFGPRSVVGLPISFPGAGLSG